jgi:hypothetical protein
MCGQGATGSNGRRITATTASKAPTTRAHPTTKSTTREAVRVQEGVLRHKERRRKRRRQLMPKRRAVAEVKIENRETPEIAIGPVTKADVADVGEGVEGLGLEVMEARLQLRASALGFEAHVCWQTRNRRESRGKERGGRKSNSHCRTAGGGSGGGGGW